MTTAMSSLLRYHTLSLETKETSSFKKNIDWVLTQTGKPGKMGRHFPVREKSGKIAQNTEKTSGNFRKSGKSPEKWEP